MASYVHRRGSMLYRGRLLAKCSAATVAGLLCFASMILASSVGEPLNTEELARSRGTNGGKLPGSFDCNAAANAGQGDPEFGICKKQGDTCFTCGRATYQDVGSVTGRYNPGGGTGNNCGNEFGGTCDANLSCVKNVGADFGFSCSDTIPDPPTAQVGIPPGD
jgi:hypothetical protein